MANNEITMESVIRRIDDIVTSEIDGEVVMMSIEKGEYYGLDLIGSDIWERMETRVKVTELIELLLEKYDVDQETCQKDVLGFLNELNAEKIITQDD